MEFQRRYHTLFKLDFDTEHRVFPGSGWDRWWDGSMRCILTETGKEFGTHFDFSNICSFQFLGFIMKNVSVGLEKTVKGPTTLLCLFVFTELF